MPAAKRKKRPVSPYAFLAPRKATVRQLDFLDAVYALTKQLGRAPSAQEVADHVGVTRWGARRQLLALEAKGYLQDIPKTVSSGQWGLTAKGNERRVKRVE